MKIKSLTSKDPRQNVLLNYQYTYDKMDNILTRNTEHGDYTYDYDDLYPLTAVDSPLQDDEAFTYDATGNRLTANSTSGSWTYNNNNELLTTNNIQYTYDDNSNMVQKTDNGVVTNYTYNVEDRLIEVRDGSGSLTASYYYDPFGRRLWKQVGGAKIYFQYADEGLVGEYGGTGAEIKTYGYVPGSTWTTGPIFMKQGDNYYFYHNDHLGTPQKTISVNGTVMWSSTYSSFGEATVDVEAVINNLRLPGQYYDQGTGLYYNRFRYYDPVIVRYLTPDPIVLLASDDVSLYVYGSNSPVVYIDSFGLLTLHYWAPGSRGKEKWQGQVSIHYMMAPIFPIGQLPM